MIITILYYVFQFIGVVMLAFIPALFIFMIIDWVKAWREVYCGKEK